MMYGTKFPPLQKKHIQSGLDKKAADTPTAKDTFLKHTFTQIIGNNRLAFEAAAVHATTLGYYSII